MIDIAVEVVDAAIRAARNMADINKGHVRGA